MSGCSLSSLPGTGGRWVLLAALLLASSSMASRAGPAPSSPGGPATGLVTYAEGPPFTVIRGDELRTGTRGVALLAGDILETGPEDFLVVQLQSGSLVGIGPGSSVYFTERAGALRLLVREGWVKADFRPLAAAGPAGHGTLAAYRLSIQCQEDVVVMHASATRDEIFDEQGESMLLPRGPALPHTDPQMRPGQLITSDNRMEVVVTARPSADFLEGMPKPFRDALPPADAPPSKPIDVQLLRKVSYADVEGWLNNALADWREGFVPRFRGRLKDPAFFAAMDAHLTQHPEWTLILHPPPPPPPKIERDLRRPAAGRSDSPRPAADESADEEESAADEPPDVGPPAGGPQPPAGPQPAAGGASATGAAPQPPAGTPAAAGPRSSGDHPPADGPHPQTDAPPDGRRPQA